jgi:hypothetical protein
LRFPGTYFNAFLISANVCSLPRNPQSPKRYKLIIWSVSVSSWYLVAFRSKYFPQLFVLKHPLNEINGMKGSWSLLINTLFHYTSVNVYIHLAGIDKLQTCDWSPYVQFTHVSMS